ncbi:MAG: hypothetical protein JXP34_09650 [Planctomycetes bacterium]|nr:hypothetical protein [Planctomycetota bacterium]
MRPRRIWLERGARTFGRCGDILSRFPGVPVSEIESIRELPRGFEGRLDLAVAVKRGEAVKPFAGGCYPDVPEFFVAGALGCPCDCAYCYVQGYLESRVPVVFANPEDVLTDIAETLERVPRAHIHVGHLADGLILEPLAGIAAPAIDLIRRAPEATLEIRTKGTSLDALPPDPPPNALISWTFSPRTAVARFERGTASLAARIAAAREAAGRGYRIGIRIDPIIRFPGWRAAYRDLASVLLRDLRREWVRDCVLGTFRFPADLEPVLRARAEAADLLSGDIAGEGDGKRRYFRPLRVETLRVVASRLGGHVRIGLAMEDPGVWRDVFAGAPPE